VCYDAKSYCTFCGQQDEEVCACYGFCGSEPDGTTCEIWQAQDWYYEGTCQQGTCVVPF
jgi:hypothetical protein